MWQWIGTNEKQLKAVFAFIITIVGSVGIFEYIHTIAEEKIERTIKYIDKYSSGEIRNYREPLLAFWLNPKHIAEKEKIRASEYNSYIINLVENNSWEIPLYSISNFYNQLIICVNRELCDAEVACDFFGEDMRAFINNYYGYIVFLDNMWKVNIYDDINSFLQKKCDSKEIVLPKSIILSSPNALALQQEPTGRFP